MRVGEEKAERRGGALIDRSEAITTSNEPKIGRRRPGGLVRDAGGTAPQQESSTRFPR